LGQIEIREPDQGIGPRLGARLRDSQRSHEGIPHLFGKRSGRLTSVRQPDPDLGLGGSPARELLERDCQLSIEASHLACVGKEREPQRRIWRLREDSPRCRARSHRIARCQRLLSLAQVTVGAGEHNLDLAEETANDIREAHSRQA
jgi:hypothetical protein